MRRNDGVASKWGVWVIVGILGIATMGARAADGEKKEEDEEKGLTSGTLAELAFRSIGPAVASGRIGDFAVDPRNPAHYFVAVSSGGVWKTDNGGATYEPIFDGEGSYSIGCIKLDPNNPNVVWVGSGENNSQRSVSFGDGVYRSRDGGKSWENLGLKDSEHIGMIAIDPRNSNTVYVAAQGPLWRSGGDRGLYKTTDGGATWQRVLHIGENTGVNEVHLDPRDPDVIYASAYQRRRHVWTLVNGGPESAIYKSIDGGITWRKLAKGIPAVDKGRIGLAISPVNPDVVYAIVEAQNEESGFFRSSDRGETWKKMSNYATSSPQYYNEIVCDPQEVDRVYSLNTFLHVTEDGGKSFKRMSSPLRHVDDHALWIEPGRTDHMLIGCDGGIYETFDRGTTWIFKPNLPITQFYRVAVDNDEPFYNVYGGTQDNNTLGGPSRTISRAGITNEDWIVTVGGDGFEPQVDPIDPDIVYSQWQHGGLVRFDRKSGEIVDIKPREKPGEEGYRWNWDSPLIISPHDPKRLYFACNKLFKSDDRGDSWSVISPDLSRGVDRDKLPVMGKIQSVDAVARHKSTSIYGNCVALTESPKMEGLIYVGTDDGLVHVTEDGGGNWRTIPLFPGIPDNTYVSGLFASRHHPDRVFAAFDNHKMGDFKPYLLRSDDRGKTWISITGDLPDREIIYSIREDFIRDDLLFAGTEFGVYVTLDGGQKWLKLKGGLPTIAVRDIEIQQRECDLVLATFGRGFYILDNYAPLREITDKRLEEDALLFDVKPALRYVETSRLGNSSGRGTQGDAFYAALNPPNGAVFTYYLKDKMMTLTEKRREEEKKAMKADKPIGVPSLDQLRLEEQEKPPKVYLIIKGAEGQILRRIEVSRDKGIHRAEWDLRYPTSLPTTLASREDRPPWEDPPAGPLALPGTYSVTLAKEQGGQAAELAPPKFFEVRALDLAAFAARDKAEVLEFERNVSDLQRAVLGAGRVVGEVQGRLDYLRKAFDDTPGADPGTLTKLEDIRRRLIELRTRLSGDATRRNRELADAPSITERVQFIVESQSRSTSPPTQTQREGYIYAGTEFEKVLADLKKLVTEDLAAVEKELEAAGAPWTPGRLPEWNGIKK